MTTLFATTLGLNTAATVAGAIGQNEQFKANAANALASNRIANQQTNLGIQQSEAEQGRKAQETQVEMLKAAATAKASANENGVSGNSVDALINDYHASEGRFISTLQQQAVWNRNQAGMSKQGQKAQAQQQINSVAKPDFLGTALRIGGGALDAYNRSYGNNPTR